MVSPLFVPHREQLEDVLWFKAVRGVNPKTQAETITHPTSVVLKASVVMSSQEEEWRTDGTPVTQVLQLRFYSFVDISADDKFIVRGKDFVPTQDGFHVKHPAFPLRMTRVSVRRVK